MSRKLSKRERRERKVADIQAKMQTGEWEKLFKSIAGKPRVVVQPGKFSVPPQHMPRLTKKYYTTPLPPLSPTKPANEGWDKEGWARWNKPIKEAASMPTMYYGDIGKISYSTTTSTPSSADVFGHYFPTDDYITYIPGRYQVPVPYKYPPLRVGDRVKTKDGEGVVYSFDEWPIVCIQFDSDTDVIHEYDFDELTKL